ncbi:MAG: ABC transporter permease, partial [Planctomycetaceae bacterium]|nr:ABC transporter permease [Planctomycetaceae bacterium]
TRFVAGLVGLSITRTLGPVLTAIIFTGRVGAAYTAELGTMKVSDELLALETMGISSIGYLAAPRVLAGAFALLALTVIFDLCALTSALLMCTMQFGVDQQIYMDVTHAFVDMWDLGFGMFKGVVFSLLISMIACYKGFNVKGSGLDVGRATMESVVMCLVVVIFADFVLSLVFNIASNFGLVP